MYWQKLMPITFGVSYLRQKWGGIMNADSNITRNGNGLTSGHCPDTAFATYSRNPGLRDGGYYLVFYRMQIYSPQIPFCKIDTHTSGV